LQIPQFITFTGLDNASESTINRLNKLEKDYPSRIEIGILYSNSRAGIEKRYPNIAATYKMVEAIRNISSKIGIAAHLCGSFSKQIKAGGSITSFTQPPLGQFDRIQINTDELTEAEFKNVQHFCYRENKVCILQSRDTSTFPPPTFVGDNYIKYVYDLSGGKGVLPDTWPERHKDSIWVGYAGGINPDNVTQVLESINSSSSLYWIDMESGVRDEDDKFCLDRVESVLKQVYNF
jgi:hypothetical protein